MPAPSTSSSSDSHAENDLLHLFEACKKGDLESVRMHLRKKKSAIHEVSRISGFAALHIATKHEQVELVRHLITNGASVNMPSEHERKTALHLAVESKNCNLIRLLLNSGACMLVKDIQGESPLHMAIRISQVPALKIMFKFRAEPYGVDALFNAIKQDELNKVRTLLESGLDPNKHFGKDGSTFLFEATMHGNIEIMNLLIQAGAKVNMKTKSGFFPLVVASEFGHLDACKLLISEGADVNLCTEPVGTTALTMACEKGHLDIVKVLVDNGSEVNHRICHGDSGVIYAAQNGYTDIVKILIDAGANVNIANHTCGANALTLAAENGHQDMIPLLLQAGAELDKKTTSGSTALIFAAARGHEQIVQMLLDAGANVNHENTRHGSTALTLAAETGHEAVVRLLLAKGANASHRINMGDSAIIYAAQNGFTTIVRMLLEFGADPNNYNKTWGASALTLSAERGHDKYVFKKITKLIHRIVCLLLANGADVNHKTKGGGTALVYASEHGRFECVRALLQHGADVCAVNDKGASSLSLAAEKGFADIVHVLLQYNIIVNQTNKFNCSAVHYALKEGHANIVQHLYEAGADVNPKVVPYHASMTSFVHQVKCFQVQRTKQDHVKRMIIFSAEQLQRMLQKMYSCKLDFAFELVPNGCKKKKQAQAFQVAHNCVGVLDESEVYSVRLVAPTLFAQKERLGRRFDSDCVVYCQDAKHEPMELEWHSFGKLLQQSTAFPHQTSSMATTPVRSKKTTGMFNFFW